MFTVLPQPMSRTTKMKKIDTHQWIQTLGNIGVIASIIFLSVQVSQNRQSLDEANKLNAMTLSSDAVQHFNNLRALIANDEQVAQIWVKGRAGEELTRVEGERFKQVCESWIWALAWEFRQAPNFGRPESAVALVDFWHNSLERNPGLRTCWDAIKQMVDDDGFGSFVRAVDDAKPLVLPPSPVRPIGRDDENQK
jgi:hypothetical protein